MAFIDTISAKWEEQEFKRYFVGTLLVFAALLFFDYVTTLAIGTLGGFFSLVLIAMIGRSMYQNRSVIRQRSVTFFLVFMIIYLLLGFFAPPIIEIFVFDASLVFMLWMILHVVFWFTFFLFWFRETKLPTRTLAYIAALSLYSTLLNLAGVALISRGDIL